jgi:adenosine deaminase
VALSPEGTKIVKTRDPKKPLDLKEIQLLHQETFGMPKIELHAHIGGCFRPTTFLELAEKEGADLDKIDFYNVTIETAFEFFKIGSKLVKDLPTLQRVTYEIIEDYNK